MSDSKQVRLNELARELEIKAKVLIDFLPTIGVKVKKTHSSSIDIEHAELARKHFQGLAAAEAAAEAAKTAAAKAKTAPRPAPGPAATVPAAKP
ncbi:MAG: translation initiation factor IF-2 N-terminal domain-containing protein, partial [Candidatus Acidiferrales bacterium]